MSTLNRPHATVVLAMTADGKIADHSRSPARFSTATDRFHLEQQIALVDAVLFGAGTLRAYGTSLPISNPQLLQARQQNSKPPQPVHIVCSASASLDPHLRFFSQSLPRWLLTTAAGAQSWQESGFERIVVADAQKEPYHDSPIDWVKAFTQLVKLGIEKVAILGGGQLVASLLAQHLIDEVWLTVCPLIFGGVDAPTPVEGTGLLAQQAQSLELLSVERIDQEIFLHYRLQQLNNQF